MANDREEAEKAYRFAEERFVAGALRSARNAKRLFASLPALQNAAAAYEVHAAVAAAARGGRNWYAVLGLPSDATHEDIKKQYKRLCLVLHPDKNRSAAADGAFKLLQRAWEALSARHPPGPASASKPSRAQPRRTYYAPPPRASPSRAKTGCPGSRPPPPDWPSFGFTPPPEPDGSTFDFKAWRAAYARANGTIYCGHCDTESAAEGASHGKPSERCHSCGARCSPPRRSRATPGTGAEPPPPPPRGDAPRQREGGEFTCPAACPRCGTRFLSSVAVGMCKLRCRACSYDATVHVRSRDSAVAF